MGHREPAYAAIKNPDGCTCLMFQCWKELTDKKNSLKDQAIMVWQK